MTKSADTINTAQAEAGSKDTAAATAIKSEMRQRAASKEHRQAEVLDAIWQMGWRMADGSRMWLARDNDTAAEKLGMAEGHLRAVIRQLAEAGAITKLQRGLWLIRHADYLWHNSDGTTAKKSAK